MIPRTVAMVLSVVVLCSCALPSLREAPSIVLTEDGRKACPIFVDPDAHPDERLAANELAAYLNRISGAGFVVTAALDIASDRAILVGPSCVKTPKRLGEEDYIIKTDGQRLIISGGAPRGALYGVYGFLEDALGCRWWSHTEEFTPKRATIEVGKLDIVGRPAFAQHSLYNKEVQYGANQFAYKCRGTSAEQFDGGHTLCPYLAPYSKENPHFLPMNENGERKFNNLHLCYTAKGMPEALAEALSKRVEFQKGDLKHVIYFAGMGDWSGGMCQCPECKAIYEEETWINPDAEKRPGYTATLIRMMNKTAEILEKKYPGIRIGTFAYMSLEAPPNRTVPRDNVVLWMPHLRHCIVHGIAECKENRSFLLNLQRWIEIAPGRVYIWDYGINFHNFMYPFPNIKAMAGNVKTYKQMGVRGVSIQGNYVSMGSDMIVLRNYVLGKLLWNPDLDTDKLIDEFCVGYYGPAGPDMAAYVDTLENSVRSPVQTHLNEFEQNIKEKYLSGEVVGSLKSSLERAFAATNGEEPYFTRVKEAAVSLDAVELWTQGPLKEQGDRLVREDLGNTWGRVHDLLKHSRGASPREWGDGRSYRMGFLTMHGGPLVTLKRDALEVKVAPILNGRIRRIIYEGKDILHVPAAELKESSNSSGSYENLDPGASIYEIVGQPSQTSVVISAELGIKHWGSATLETARKEIELTGDGKMRITGSSRQVARNSTTITASSVTEYAAGADMTNIVVEFDAGGGKWQPASILPEPPSQKADARTEPNLGAVSRLRIYLPAQNVTVVDRYSAPAITGGYVWVESQRGALVTQVGGGAVSLLPGQGEGRYLSREIEIKGGKTRTDTD